MKSNDIQPDAQYSVQLSEKIHVYGQPLHPGATLRMRGDLLLTVLPSVKHAELIAREG